MALVLALLLTFGVLLGSAASQIKSPSKASPDRTGCPSDAACASLKLLTLNVWGLPEAMGSRLKAERMEALAGALLKMAPDVILLEELWMEADHVALSQALRKEGYVMTEFRQLALKECDGVVTPIFCSGGRWVGTEPRVA